MKVKNNATIEEMFMVVVFEELSKILGEERIPLNLQKHTTVILMSGLQGSGKTTFTAKLGNYLKCAKNKRVLLVAADIYRPAAKEQLKILASSIAIEVYAENNNNAVEIALNAVNKARREGYDVVIIDTAGRLSVDEEMMTEIENIKRAIVPQEILFVVDSMTGQDAVKTAKAFNDRLDYTGIVLTKLDGDTRGGAALSIKGVVDKPIKFIGTGEKIGDIEEFNPKGIANRILGRGDLQALMEKIGATFSEEEGKNPKSDFTFNDFLDNINRIKKMGSLKMILKMIPGMGNLLKNVDVDDDAFKKIESMIQSMTPAERNNPEIVIKNISRKKRIAKGSGNSMREINNFIGQFDKIRKMMKQISKGKLSGLPGNLPLGNMPF